jgi:hypothetical protein
MDQEKIRGGYLRALESSINWFLKSGIMPSQMGEKGVYEKYYLLKENPLKNSVRYAPLADQQMGDGVFSTFVRSDCCLETAYAFRLYYEVTGQPRFKQIAENLVTFTLTRLQEMDGRRRDFGAFAFGIGTDDKYIDDNGWILSILSKLYVLDGDRSVLAAAERLADWFCRNLQTDHWLHVYQRASSSWFDFPSISCNFKALYGMSDFYLLTGEERAIRTARKVTEWLLGKQLPNGRFITGYEVSQGRYFDNEPVSAPTINGACALANLYYATGEERYLKGAEGSLAWLMALQDESGAVPQADSKSRDASGKNSAQVADLVYGINWYPMACHIFGKTTGDEKVLDSGRKALDFLTRIQIKSSDAALDGVWRGSFDFRRNEWAGQNWTESNKQDEGGCFSVYSGWTNAPIAWSLAVYGTDGDFRLPQRRKG